MKGSFFPGSSSSLKGGGIFTVYIDNLPNGVGLPWLRKFFSNFGRVTDAYLPSRRSIRTGNRFGFIRYDSSRGAVFAVEKANGFWIGKRNIIVQKASYDKDLGFSEFRGNKSITEKGFIDGRVMGPKKEIIEVGMRLSLNLQPVDVEWLTRSAIAKLKALTTPELVQKALRELNFNDAEVKSMGGLKIIITFQTKADRDLALSSPVIINWFNLFKPWNGEVAGESRLVWLKCRGMPLSVWNVASFKHLGELWGDFITLDVETMKGESFDVGRILVATENPEKIEEWININVRGKNHRVRVWEEACDDIFNEKPISDWVSKQHSLPLVHHSPEPNREKEIEPLRNTDGDWVSKQHSLPLVHHSPEPNREKETEPLRNTDGDSNDVVLIPNGNSEVELQHKEGNSDKAIGINLDVIREEAEESFVGETPNLGSLVEPNHCGPISKVEVPKVPSAREKRAKIRKDIRDILGTLENEYQVEEVRAISSDHSDSINTEDIQRRNLAIIKGFENAVNISKRLGVIHHESDEMVIKRMAQRHGETLNKRVLPATMS